MASEHLAMSSDAGRITVVRDRHLVPLLASSHHHAPIRQPWKGVLLEQHRVAAGEIPRHEHPQLCLHLQLSGSDDFEWWSGGRDAVEHTTPGSMILIPPGTADRLHWMGPSERLVLTVRQDRLDDLASGLGIFDKPDFRANWAFADPALRHLITEMGREAREGWPLGELYAELLALGLETQLLRSQAVRPLQFPSWKGGLALPKLRRAMEYTRAHLADEVRLEDLARELGLSESHFAHEFRNSTGQTPYQYLLDQRIRRAKDLLRGTTWPVQRVAAEVGFGSAVNFVRAFRQRVGRTPAAWRKAS